MKFYFLVEKQAKGWVYPLIGMRCGKPEASVCLEFALNAQNCAGGSFVNLLRGKEWASVQNLCGISFTAFIRTIAEVAVG